MSKTAIVFASTHHQNTRKLADAIAAAHDVTLIDATRCEVADLTNYDIIGFASGIDFSRFYAPVEAFLARNLPLGKRVFFLYTAAAPSPRFTQSVKAAATQKGAVLLGEYGCKGYNTYGPWKLIGGMNKRHPTAKEVADAVAFFESLHR